MVKAQDRNGKSFTPRLEKNLQNFLKSLSNVLTDITALEVNTMVVEQITGNKFIPWQVYRDVYPISREYLETLSVHHSLRSRYLSLRKQLEIEYCLLLTEDNPTAIQDCHILTEPNATLDEIQTQLPNPLNLGDNPSEVRKINFLLDDGRFLRSLRKIAELKAALDNRNKALNKAASENSQEDVTTDLIYAQTVIQLDGDIINRFHQQLLEHPHKDIIIKIHQEGVIAGERQWRGMFEFVVSLVQSILAQRSAIKNLTTRL